MSMSQGDPQTISFGPPTSQWHYHPSTKTYDLTRGNESKFLIETTEGVPGTSIQVATGKSVLVVVDMQNFFLDGENKPGHKAVEPTINVIKKCREVGIQVIWLNWGLTDEDMTTLPPSVLHGFARTLITSSHSNPTSPTPSGLGIDLGTSDTGIAKGRTLFANTWNADIYPPLKKVVEKGDLHCRKNRMSGLWSGECELWGVLSGEGGGRKETVFFAGVNTDQCVLGTLTDAYNAGWDCIMINDCCATPTDKGKEVCLHNVSRNYGFVVDSSTFCAGKLS